MKTPNKLLMADARKALSGKWGVAVGAGFIAFLVTTIAQIIPLINLIAPILIAGPMTLGLAIFFLALARGKEVKIAQVFSGFDRFGTAVGAYLLSILFIILWSLLLIIPGIIAAFAYSQMYFLLADNPHMGPMEAIDKSKAIMRGNKWKLFCLGLRFIGWALLSILTLGIGFLWFVPYISTASAKFYEDVKNGATLAAEPAPATA